MFKRLIRESSLLAPDFKSFQRQETTFIVLNLFVLAGLLLLHTIFSFYFGVPPKLFIVVMVGAIMINAAELLWVRRVKFLPAETIVPLTWFTIALNMALASILASLSYRQDTQYFALLVAPILQAAFRLSLGMTLAVLAATTALEFFWVWSYFHAHPPALLSEYLETVTLALIFATVGILVWTLVDYLRSKQVDLEHARERLAIEESLAAVGRFSSAIAHEIRNPVAMISSALATAANDSLDSAQRKEMFEIAAKEASRLEKLTSDFLVYARPRAPAKIPGDISESIAYVADICRPHATEKAVTIRAAAPEGLRSNMDSGQVQQALLNIVMNAVEASAPGSAVSLCGRRTNGLINVEVENSNGPIPLRVVDRIFEPFFTTKPGGTGLGLAIARNIARGHGGELVLARNEADAVCFLFTLPAYADETGSL